MFDIEIHSTLVKERSGTSKAGKPYHIREQQGFVYLNGEPYPQKLTIPLGDGQAPHAKGNYSLTPEFFVGQFGDLRIGMRDAQLVVNEPSKVKAVNG